MELGFFTMPIHRLERDYVTTLKEDREAFILADRLGFSEGFVGEHVTDAAETITSSMMFIASLVSDTKRIKLGTGTANLSHSHPVLTLNTRFVDDDRKQLAMFLHEQFHWYTFERGDQMGAATAEVRERFPTVPVGKPEGAHSEFSTYIHLIVCYLELQAVTELQGESFARESLAANKNYTWIYEQVLSDDGFIKGVLQRHGLSLP